MTDTNTHETARTKAPSHYAYHVRDPKLAKGYWRRIGTAWSHVDGGGFNIQLDGIVPLDGRIVLRVPTDKKD